MTDRSTVNLQPEEHALADTYIASLAAVPADGLREAAQRFLDTHPCASDGNLCRDQAALRAALADKGSPAVRPEPPTTPIKGLDLNRLRRIAREARNTYVGTHWPSMEAMRRDGIGHGLVEDEAHERFIRRYLDTFQPDFVLDLLDRVAAIGHCPGCAALADKGSPAVVEDGLRVCPDCKLTAARIGNIHIDAQIVLADKGSREAGEA